MPYDPFEQYRQTAEDTPQPTAPRTFSPQDRDAIIRTVIGEAGGEPAEGQAAVAHVIMNRVNHGRFGDSPTAVVTAPHQFEAVSRGVLTRNIPQSEYDRVGQVVDGVLNGQMADPTKGATYFYSPKVQSALGRQAPSWANSFSPTVAIGTHQFYADPDHPGASSPARAVNAAAPADDPFKVALADFDTHAGAMKKQYNPNPPPATPENPQTGGMDPRLVLMLSNMNRPVTVQPAKPGTMPDYANAAGGTPNILAAMMEGRQKSNLAALIANQGASS